MGAFQYLKYYIWFFFTVITSKGTSPCVQGIFWDSNTVMVAKMDHFLKNAKKQAILGHFVRLLTTLQNFTESKISLSFHVPHSPNLEPRFFWITVMPYVLLEWKIFIPPPCRENKTLEVSVVETDKYHYIVQYYLLFIYILLLWTCVIVSWL